jgi:rare lipoprotein A
MAYVKKWNTIRSFCHLTSVVCLLAACATQKPPQTAQPTYKVGQPYEVSGTWYYPQENYSYDETGIASWYGEGFHGGRTANGEVFNKDELTAAHPTLPMPSLARVTNLDNGRSIVVRINDRGPFEKGRLIDVSQRAAQLLGFEQTGTAKVRVQVLADESKAIADAMRHYGSPAPIQVAAANPGEAPPMQAAPVAAVTAQNLEPPSNTVETAPQPTLTTPAIHQQLVATEPVPEVVQLPVTSHNHIYVQAGSFKNLDNATRLKQHLEGLGTVTVTDAMVNGAKFYRVRVGPIANVASADTMLQRVTKAGVAKPRIIVD